MGVNDMRVRLGRPVVGEASVDNVAGAGRFDAF